MFDNITLVTPPLSDEKIEYLFWRNGLQEHSRNGLVYYDNQATKNFIQQKGIYIKIETNRQLRLEGSLHKYYNETNGRDRNNYNLFTMREATAAIVSLLHDKGIDEEGARVYNYEIGLNLNVSKDCRTYLEKMKSIGAIGDTRELYVNPLYVNPRHRNERMKVTGFKKVRVYHKVYDKVHECVDKKRKIIPDGNILRIETVYKRLDKCSVTAFFHPDNLKKLVEKFFRDWRTIQFDRDIITPKGTGRAKRQLCIEIISKSRDEVLQEAKAQHGNGSLSDWEYRNTREFITHEWDEVKNHITFIQSDEEKEFRELLNVNYTILKHDEISK